MIVALWIVGSILAIFALTVLRGAPYVPSRSQDIEKAFDDLYRLQDSDMLVDIGSGDGKVCLAAARRGARAIGFEINPMLVLLSRWRARRQPRVTFRLADFWHTELPRETTIVYTFGDGRDIQRMADWVQTQATRLQKPIYFLSYAFGISDRTLVTRNASYFLYEIQPSLQQSKP